MLLFYVIDVIMYIQNLMTESVAAACILATWDAISYWRTRSVLDRVSSFLEGDRSWCQ